MRANQRQLLTLRAVTTRFLRAEKLSLTDFHVLQLIAHAGESGGPARPQTVCRKLEISASTLTSITERLAAAGLVVRERHPLDRRRTSLSLTEAGTAVLWRHHRMLCRGYAEVFAAHPEAALAAVLDIIDVLDAASTCCSTAPQTDS